MPEISARFVVLVVALAVYTVVTAVFDQRYRRIPNAVTVPMFAAGWVFQLAFGGLAGLADGGLGFLLGFGTLLLLWLIGVAGGGDVKLLGGLSVWLGLRLTEYVLVTSIVFVILGTVLVLTYGALTRGVQKTKQAHFATAVKPKARRERRVMAFALPVALATWAVLIANWQRLV